MAIIDKLGKPKDIITGVDTSGTVGTVIPPVTEQLLTPSVKPTTPNPSGGINDTLGMGIVNYKPGEGSGGGQGYTPPTGNTSEGNTYYDVIASQQEQPKYQESKDTSAGSQAAKGTMYSWDKQGLDAAQNQYNQEALKAKQDALANRQVQEQNALQYQQQADMMKYANNQDAEKVGWTGGYVLDQNRQMEYLKASIQAQMYGAMELQKYGYDSALAAARLSYDLNQKEFAHKYYQDAVNVAITEAQITGTYFSAETRDMLNQLNMADQELGLYDENGKPLSLEKIEEAIKEGTSLTPEQQRALEVKRTIESWYSANKVSKTGIQTLAAWQSEQAMAQEWADKQWQMYQAALSAANTKDTEDVNVFVKYDEQGNPIYNGTNVELGNFRNMTAKEIMDYYNSTSSTGKEQVYGYVDNSFGQIVTNYLATVKTTDASGNVSYNIDAKKLKELIDANPKVTELKPILKNYSFDMPAGDASVEINIDANGNLTSKVTVAVKPKGGSGPTSEAVLDSILNDTNLTDKEKQDAIDIITDTKNKGFLSSEMTVNQAGDTFDNNNGDRGSGNNFSLLINGEKYRVQNGPQVKYNSPLDTVLNSYSTTQGSTAIVDGILYVRDNEAWYVVEGRDSYSGQWQKICKDYGLNYTSAPNSAYYTTDKQGIRALEAPTSKTEDGKTVTQWSTNTSSINIVTAGSGDNVKVNVGDTDYNITVRWSYANNRASVTNGYDGNQIISIQEELWEKYPSAQTGDIIYYNNSYWLKGKNSSWGLILNGATQDKKASDAEKLIKALNGK